MTDYHTDTKPTQIFNKQIITKINQAKTIATQIIKSQPNTLNTQ